MGREYKGAKLVRVMRTPISTRKSAKVPRTDAVSVVSVTARHSRPHSLPSALSREGQQTGQWLSCWKAGRRVEDSWANTGNWAVPGQAWKTRWLLSTLETRGFQGRV